MKNAHGESATIISIIELRRLLTDLKDKGPTICVRFRMLGDMWLNNFVRVIYVTERGVILHDEVAGKLLTILDLINVVQVELDGKFQNFQPYFHYTVKPMPEFS